MFMLTIDGKFIKNFWTIDCVEEYLDNNSITLNRVSIIQFGA